MCSSQYSDRLLHPRHTLSTKQQGLEKVLSFTWSSSAETWNRGTESTEVKRQMRRGLEGMDKKGGHWTYVRTREKSESKRTMRQFNLKIFHYQLVVFICHGRHLRGAIGVYGPRTIVTWNFFAQIRTPKTANQRRNVEIWFFSSPEMYQNHIFRSFAPDPTGRANNAPQTSQPAAGEGGLLPQSPSTLSALRAPDFGFSGLVSQYRLARPPNHWLEWCLCFLSDSALPVVHFSSALGHKKNLFQAPEKEDNASQYRFWAAFRRGSVGRRWALRRSWERGRAARRSRETDGRTCRGSVCCSGSGPLLPPRPA